MIIDAHQGLQTEVLSLSKVVIQNHMALDVLTSKEGEVCIIINQTCCSYINQEKWVETDIHQIWEKTKILHIVIQDATSWGFTNIWGKITSSLPNTH